MSLIFGPGIALMHRLTNEQKFPALAALFWPDYDQSRACRALQIASQRRDLPMMLDSLTGIAAIRAHVGEAARAAELLAFILNHPASEYATRTKARRLFAEVSVQLPPEALAEAEARGRAKELEAFLQAKIEAGGGLPITKDAGLAIGILG